jgi:hypothetical protein
VSARKSVGARVCPACVAYDAAERAAIEGREPLPPHTLGAGCKCVAKVSDVERFGVEMALSRLKAWRESAR